MYSEQERQRQKDDAMVVFIRAARERRAYEREMVCISISIHTCVHVLMPVCVWLFSYELPGSDEHMSVKWCVLMKMNMYACMY